VGGVGGNARQKTSKKRYTSIGD